MRTVLLAPARAFIALAVLFITGSVGAQEEPAEKKKEAPGEVPYIPLLIEKQRVAIADRLDTKRALRHIERLSRYHRLAPSDGLDRAMRYIARELKAAGLDAVETTTYKSDGKTTWWVEPAPPAWTCEAAELWIEAPDRRQFANWGTDPIRLAAYSTSCDVTADVVEVTDWNAELDLKGKIVLTSGDARTLHAKAVEAGAVGLLLAPAERPKDDELLTAVHPSTLSSAIEDWKTNKFAFNISAAEAAILRASLNAGKRVRARALIKNARTATSTCPIVSARITPVRPSAKRVVLLAEVAGPKPGANSLSGAGALLSLARTYKELLDEGALVQPTRNVEFLFVPDVHGACAYVKKHRDSLDDIIAVIQLGVVGTNTENGPGQGRPLQIADGGWIIHSCVPYLTLTFGRYVARSGLVDVAGTGAPLSFRMHARGPVAAHTVFYSGPVGRPALSISYFPDPSTETSSDTTDRLDPTALKRAMYMALGTAYVVATPPQWEIQRFGPFVSPYVLRDVSGAIAVFTLQVRTAPKDRLASTFYRSDTVMRQNERRGKNTTRSLEVLVSPGLEEGVKEYGVTAEKTYADRAFMVIRFFHGRIEDEKLQINIQKQFREKEVRLRREIPSMCWHGPVTEELLRRHMPEVFPLPEAVDIPTLFALINGKRVLFEIWAEHEAMKWIGIPYPLPPREQVILPVDADLDETLAFLRRCEKAGIIRIEPKKDTE